MLTGALGSPKHLGASSANECQAHAAEKQPQHARQPGGHHGGSDRKRVIIEGSNPPRGLSSETAGQDSAAGASRHEARWGCQHLGASLANECQAHPSERQPQHARQPVGITEQWTKTGQMHTRGASARKPQARTRQRALHAMRSGIAGRADAGARARQFNATPTPATAQPRSTTMALHVRHVSRASSLQAQAAATAAGMPATMWGALGLPHLSTSSANECHALASEKQPQRARQPGQAARRRWPETGSPPGNGFRWPENGSSITSNTSGHVPQRRPATFSGVPAAVAGVGSSPARNRVFAGRKSGLRYRGYISGHPLPPLFFPLHSSPTPVAGPWAPATWPDPRPGRGHPLKSNKYH
ncbi:hypothetical protein OIU74_026176 [Salix koriyanagi]|uniref:Uncharacterized protein n=1 Tax=Salix koriyanagi TaxID=2511006 RepID=A0A9Q0VXN5_9ROSI|nr:hypothetical protein OIU74_026176 [Salix koriyanagi]